MKTSEIPLEGYEFSGCAIRRWNIISLFGTKWEDKDALETRDTAVFYYYPDETPDEQWAFAEIGASTGIHGCAAFQPKEQWVFVMDDGEVYVAGGGDNDFEMRISGEKGAYFRNVKGVAGGYAYAVGTSRKVYRREAKNKWTKLDDGLPATVSGDDIGFDDLDGFGDSEIYACGGRGDLWLFDGKTWSRIDLPTNAQLWKICCGGDGLVYVLTDQRSIVVGRGTSWRVIEQDHTKDILEQLVWYQDRIYISTTDELFEIVNGVFVPCHLNVPKLESYARLASGDGILVVAGADRASMYDGSQWITIL
jgi:hypothetical protein